jgi:hypothetical protein
MRKVIFVGLLLACTAWPVFADDGTDVRVADGTGAWYISPLAQYTFLDKDRVSKDHVGYDLAVGMNFAPNWAAEVNGSIGSFKIPNSGASQQLDAYSLDVLYKFLPDSIFRPYLVAGGGGMLDRVAGGLTDHHAGFAEAGAGFLRASKHRHSAAISRGRQVSQGILGCQRVQSQGSRRYRRERRLVAVLRQSDAATAATTPAAASSSRGVTAATSAAPTPAARQ